MGICLCSVVVAANYRHSAYRFRFATIAYRWHPLFGRTLQVSPFRRGKDLMCIYTDERPGLTRELPNWMFDESYCSGMTLGQPEISITGLNKLASVLATFSANRMRGAQSSPSIRRRWIVRRNQRHKQAQLVLELERQIPATPVERNTKGLVEALADLLLEALVAETGLGGVDEPQNHA